MAAKSLLQIPAGRGSLLAIPAARQSCVLDAEGLVRRARRVKSNQRTTHVEAVVEGSQDAGSIPAASTLSADAVG